MKGLLTFLFAFAALFSSYGQEASLSAKLDTNYILIGQQTTLHLKAENLSSSADVVWTLWPDTLKGVEVVSSRRDTTESKGKFIIEEHFVLTSFDSGFVVIPPFTVLLENSKLETEPQILNIGTLEINPEQDYFDIKEPVKPPFDFLYWLKRLWILWLILVVIIVVVLWFILKKKKEKPAIAKPVDLRTPAQRAKDGLKALKDQRIWQDGKVKAYYSGVSDIVRTYLEESLNVPAMEMISDELIESMQTRISAPAQKILKQMLIQADLVKFAKAKPGPDQHSQIWDDAMEIIRLTETKTAEHDE